MLPLGNMLWRIGDRLDIDDQMAWTSNAGFDGAGLHASEGTPGQWRGVDPAKCSASRREHLRRELSSFCFTEIHAPFAIELTADTLAEDIEALAPVLDLARDLDASVITVHAGISDEGDDWLPAMSEIDRQAARAGVAIGLEVTEDFEVIEAWGLGNVGVTLDVGHMYNEQPDRSDLGRTIRGLGASLRHLHVHDTDGTVDHCEIGTGIVDFAEILTTLCEIGYCGGATLEMNPDRCSPAGIERSLMYLRRLTEQIGADR